MDPVFSEHTKYRVRYRSNERANAATYEFVADYLGSMASDEKELLFSCRPMSGTMSLNIRWYIFESIEEVPKDKANRSPHKVSRSQHA